LTRDVTDHQQKLREPKLEHQPPHGGFWESVANVGRRKTTAIAVFTSRGDQPGGHRCSGSSEGSAGSVSSQSGFRPMTACRPLPVQKEKEKL
jgi:hypothetical protein